LQVADYIARNNDGVFLFFSLESNCNALIHRCFARMAGIQLNKIRTGRITLDKDWQKLGQCVEEMTRSGLLIYDDSKFRYIENIYQHCEAISQEHNILGVGIDYLQLLNTKKQYGSKHLRYGAIADELNFMAKDFDTHIFCMSQLNADDELKESRDIEDCATNVWKLSKKIDEATLEERILLDATKGKETGLFQVNLSIDGGLMTMEEIAS
jgi:replicative DNA helicase